MPDARSEDLDVVAQSFRVISDTEAFDDLVQAWQTRLSHARNVSDDSIDEQVYEHLKNAEQLLTERPATSLQDPIRRTLSQSTSPCLVFNLEGYVMGLTEGWLTAFGHRQGKKLDESWIAPDSLELFRSLRRAVADRGNLQHAIVRLQDLAGSERVAEVFPLANSGLAPEGLVVRLLDPLWTSTVRDGVQTAFGLTDAETDICHALFRLRDTAAVAEERQTSIRTVRLQLTAIFNKTGARSQVDLIRLLALVCVRLDSAETQTMPAWSDPYGREKTFRSNTGRQLAYSWVGASKGDPIILLHGFAVASTLPRQADQLLKRMGLKIITFSRPGFGNSETNLNATVLEDTVSALEELRIHLRLERLHILAHTLTGLAVVHYNARYPGRLGSLLSIGGFFPMHIRSRRKHLPILHNTFLDLAERAPWACRMLAKTGRRILMEKGVDWYLQRAYGHSAPDEAVLRHPEYRALIRNACALAMTQGAEVFAREFELCHHDGFPELAALTCPVQLIVGDKDPQMTAERIDEFIHVQPATQLTMVPDTAELVFYSAWRQIVDLVSMMNDRT